MRSITAVEVPPSVTVPAVISAPELVSPTPDADPAVWPDDAAEAAFLGEAKDRGEVVPARPKFDNDEPTEIKELPGLDELVNRIPVEIRDVLEDLFRAKFVRVQRIPKRALKAAVTAGSSPAATP